MRPVVLVMVTLALASLSSAQLGLMGLGALGPMGLMGGLGGFGLGGLGLLGGIGMGSFGPFGGLFTGRAHFGGVRGRRSLDTITSHVTPAHEEINCVLSRDLLNCTGPHEIIQCAVELHTPIDITTFTHHVKLTDLVFKDKVINNNQVLRIVPRKLINRLGHKLPSVSVFESKSLISSESGFRVTDPVCFHEIVTLVKELPEKVKVTCAKEASME